MTASNASPSAAPGEILNRLRGYVSSAQLLEVVYRDSAGQICTVHDVVRDIFSRAGQDFIFLGRGTMLPFDRVLMLDGQQVSGTVD
jgi:Rho-binding antiterminator